MAFLFAEWLALLAGMCLLISIYLLYTQKTKTKPACIIGKDCEAVIGSRYGKTLGIENTIYGIIYYGALLAVILLQLPLPFILILLPASLVALYSVYLTYLQFFVIRGLCDYCMVANIANLVIFALLLANPL